MLKKLGKFIGILLAILMAATPVLAASSKMTWLTAGQGSTNWHSQPLETTISSQNVANLSPKWAKAGGDVSATPSVSDGVVYYPDWNGNLYAFDATTGAAVWQVNLAEISGITGAVSRTTPTIDGSQLYVGLQTQGWMLAINRKNGALIWKSQLDTNPAATITQSPAVYNNVLYVGVSSQEEGFAANPNYSCCYFRGSLAAVNTNNGKIMWQTYTTPDNGGQPGGYSGNAVWGSTPVVDPARKLVYITTGNNYTVPADVADGTTPLDPTDYVDSILALNMSTGKVVWAAPHLGLTADAWTVACFYDAPGTANCPDPAGPDYDFGQGVMEVSATAYGGNQDLVIAGQKSGKLWALNADTGTPVWMYDSGAASALGGMEWGSATDGKTAYFANSIGNFWGAVDIATGHLKWQTSDPSPLNSSAISGGANDIAAVSVANGVVYVGSLGGGPDNSTSIPTMFALDANTGSILWSFTSGSSVGAGPAIANGIVYWGTGYARLGIGSPAGANNFYAFSLP